MAEALARSLAGDRVEAASAGTHPAGVNPMTIEVMQELGIDMRQHRSKHVEEFTGKEFDYVITVCDRAKERCPMLPGARTVRHWSFDDPAAASPDSRQEVFRRVRDEIAERVSRFLSEEVQTPSLKDTYGAR